jgi:alkanesulfonate monooxygenase SsuD/methylene tetrahydromethanopterin reductase-like flavin-dependent oxidoreductase (luciferase family)
MRAMAAAVTSDVVDRLAIVGDPDACRRRLLELVAAGVTHPVVSLIGAEPEIALDVIATIDPP